MCNPVSLHDRGIVGGLDVSDEKTYQNYIFSSEKMRMEYIFSPIRLALPR